MFACGREQVLEQDIQLSASQPCGCNQPPPSSHTVTSSPVQPPCHLSFSRALLHTPSRHTTAGDNCNHARTDADGDDGDEGYGDDGEDVEDAAAAAAKTQQQQQGGKRRGKQQHEAADEAGTLATPEHLAAKKGDTTFAIDPLFHAMSALFDEGGAKGGA